MRKKILHNNISCPICKKKSSDKFKPFCSKTCGDIDLSKWLSGNYFVEEKDKKVIKQ
tara:strand:+ start:40 stop:210 length:171 start_codon:yes stop_codon:yes gene_type:complete